MPPDTIPCNQRRFNRYIVECKLNSLTHCVSGYADLIDT